MQFIREKLTGTLSREAEVSLAGTLQTRFRPVVSGARGQWARLLELPSKAEPLGGDLVLTPDGDLLYYRVSPQRDSLVAGAAWTSSAVPAAWEDFRAMLAEAVGNRGWAPSPLVSPGFQMLREEAVPLQVGEAECCAARVLARPSVRRLLQVISRTPGIALQQAAEGRNLAEVGGEVQELADLGLLAREFEVFCRTTEQKISRVASLSALDEAAGRGFKCFHCGRSISEEQILQLLTVTPKGVHLSQPNVWLAMLLGGVLAEKGVDPSRLVWRREPEQQIVEVFADVEGSLFMFEILEDEAAYDAVFRFTARARFFEPDAGFLVTPVPVRDDARRVLAARGDNLQILDNLSELGDRIEVALEEASRAVVRRLLGDFVPGTEVPVAHLVGQYILGEAHAPIPSTAFPGLPPLEAAGPVGEAPRVAEPVTAPELSLLEGLPSREPAERLGEVPSEVVPEPAAEALLQPPLPAAPAGPEGLASQAFPGGQDPEELLASKVARILATLVEFGPGDENQELRELVQEVSQLPGCSAMLADSDGLVFLGDLATVEEPELVAALHTDLVGSVRGTLEEAGLGEVEGILLDGARGRLALYPSVEGLSLLVHSTHSPLDEAGSPSGEPVPGGMDLVLEGLAGLEGVRGSLVCQGGGLPVASRLAGESQADLLGSWMDRTLSEAEQFLEPLGMAPPRQVLLRTPGAWFSVMPLGAGGFLAALLEPAVPPQLWQGRLAREASVVADLLG